MTLGEGTAILDAPRPTPMSESAPRSEVDLVAACRAGRREAFDELVARYYNRIYRLAYAMAGAGAASDLAQETFLAAVKSFANFRGEAQLATWLISILRNQYSLWLRGRRQG